MKQKEKFKCIRCGKCCMLRIKISDKDIGSIEKKSYTDFIDNDIEGKKFIKRINGFCYFLTLDRGIASCKIYSVRPDGCRKYPFFENGVMECSAVKQKL